MLLTKNRPKIDVTSGGPAGGQVELSATVWAVATAKIHGLPMPVDLLDIHGHIPANG